MSFNSTIFVDIENEDKQGGDYTKKRFMPISYLNSFYYTFSKNSTIKIGKEKDLKRITLFHQKGRSEEVKIELKATELYNNKIFGEPQWSKQGDKFVFIAEYDPIEPKVESKEEKKCSNQFVYKSD